MKPGDTLRNGAIVVECNEEFVLAVRPSKDGYGPYHPYITWGRGVDGDTFWGHYFFDLAEAKADFDRRSSGGKK